MTQQQADKLNAAKVEVKRLWTAACNHDQIDPASKFVVFTFDNPFGPKHGEAMTAFMKLRNRIHRAELQAQRRVSFEVR